MARRFSLEPKKHPSQARAKVTYAAIVKSAARVLEKRGYAALTTNHVARQAGIGIASLYEYFPNKESVVAAVVGQTVEEIVAELEASLATLVGTRDVAIREWIAAMFQAVDKRRALVTVLLGEVPFLHRVPAMIEVRSKLLRLSARGDALGGTPPAEHREARVYLLAIMVSNAIVEAVLRPPPHLTRAELEATLSDLVIRANG